MFKINRKKLVSNFVSQESFLIHRFFEDRLDFDLLIIKLRDNLDLLIMKGGDKYE